MELPKKEGKTKVRDRYLYYLIEKAEGQIAVEQRTEQGIWKGLFQFRLIELNEPNAPEKAIAQARIASKSEVTHISEEVKHILSHQRLHVRFIHVNHSKIPTDTADTVRWVTESEFHKLAIPRLIDKYLEKADSIFGMPDEIG